MGFKNIAKILPIVNQFLQRFFIQTACIGNMENLSSNDKLILLQYAINKYETENILVEKLKYS